MPPVNLKKILDERTFLDFRQLLYEITGMFTSLCIPSWKKGQVDYVPSDSGLRLCKIIQCCPEGKRMCDEADQIAVCDVAERKRPIITQCHLGIIGVAVPVFFRKKFLGVLFAGDFLPRKPNAWGFNRVCKKLKGLDIDFEELEKAYYEIPVIAPRTTKLAIDMLSLIVNYMVDREQIIHLQETIYRKQKQLASALMEKVEFEKGFKQQIDEVRKLRQQLAAGTETGILISEDDSTRTRRVVQSAVEYIDNYYSEELTLKDVADHVNLSQGYFSGVFHREYGCTFMEYLIRKRIRKACELLQDFRLSVTDVAMRVGYYNVSYFNQVFKRTVGMPPRQFRNRVSSGELSSGS